MKGLVEVSVDIYKRGITCLIGLSYEEMTKKLGSRALTKWMTFEEAKEVIDFCEKKAGITMLLDSGHLFLWVKNEKIKSRFNGTIAHEISHASQVILDLVGIPLTRDTREAHSYLIDHITEQIYAKLA
jgi:hypothetical protein